MLPTNDTTAGKLSTSGGGDICHGLLYLPEFGCGVQFEINLCREKNEKIQKLTAEKFNELKNELKCSYSLDVDISRDLAKVIAEEKGTFTGKNYYEDKSGDQSDLEHAMMCAKDLYFNIHRSAAPYD
jgi:hypothetical protein